MRKSEKQKEESKTPVYYAYKDRIFRLLFKDKKKLLELYNALNETAYTNENDLIVNTLDNAIFMKMKNDIAFIIDCNMCLYEHQSTYCPNMPLRGLLYFADLYKKLLKDTDLSIRKHIKIPTPHYIVFYNGLERKEEEFVQKLSEAFEDGKAGCMELIVRTININYGKSRGLLSKSETLSGYAYLVAVIRKNLASMEMRHAVEAAVEECIDKGILKEFLLEQKSEVIAMSIYEYNEEYVRKAFYEEGKENGYEEGKAEGEVKGKTETLVKSVEAVMKNFKVELQKACEGIGITVDEYRKAKAEVRQNKTE